MVRAAWVKPMTLVQKFEANEAVAATNCFLLSCDSNAYSTGAVIANRGEVSSTTWKEREGDNLSGGAPVGWKHELCENTSNNVFNYGDGGIEFVSGTGYDTGITWGGIDNWTDVDEDGKISDGDIVYWYTKQHSGLFDYRWNHYGTLKVVDPTHPNHS